MRAKPALRRAFPIESMTETCASTFSRHAFRHSAAGECGARLCCGIDLQGDSLAVVHAERTRRGVRYRKIAAADLATQAGKANKHEFVVGAMPARECFSRWLDAPLASQVKARKVFPALLDIQLPFPVESCVCDFLQTHRTAERHVRTLAVAARVADVQRRIERFQEQGWDPHGLDHEGLALWTQSLDEESDPTARPGAERRVVVYLGRDRWTVALGRGRKFAGSHALRAGDRDHLRRVLKSAWPAEARTEEPATAAAPVRWAWAGPCAADPQTAPDLRRTVENEWPGSSLLHAEPETFLARALAARALCGGPYRCNLRRGALTHAVTRERERRRQAGWAWFGLAAGAALLIGSGALQMRLSRLEEESTDRFAEMRDRIIGYPMNVFGDDALEQARKALAQRRQELRPFARALEPSLLVRLESLLDACRATDVLLDELVVNDERITARGTLPRWKGGVALRQRLVESGYGAPALERRPARDDGRIPFTLETGAPP